MEDILAQINFCGIHFCDLTGKTCTNVRFLCMINHIYSVIHILQISSLWRILRNIIL